jgi:hypothetical protein
LADTIRICRYCGSGAVNVGQTPAPDGSIIITCGKCNNSYVEPPPSTAGTTQPSLKPEPAPLKPPKTDAEKNREADGLLKEGLAHPLLLSRRRGVLDLGLLLQIL